LSSPTAIALIGLGANLGDARDTLAKACDAIAGLPATALIARSSCYASAPIGFTDQPTFINAVAKVATSLAPLALLKHLQALELRFGRVRSFPNAPRTLDLDLLLYGNTVLSSSALTLPHPRMCERAFVLIPLVEICPEIDIPGHGRAASHLAAVAHQHVMRLAEQSSA
jgi:2-amino-4-hydroxy-6-hydroxymethyldihydropteridine diphosphokinase